MAPLAFFFSGARAHARSLAHGRAPALALLATPQTDASNTVFAPFFQKLVDTYELALPFKINGNVLRFVIGYIETVGAVTLLTRSWVAVLFNVALIGVMAGATSLHVARNEPFVMTSALLGALLVRLLLVITQPAKRAAAAAAPANKKNN